MNARLGAVLTNKVQMNREMPEGALESPVIVTMIMKLVLRDLVKSWKVRNLAWTLDDFVLAATCYADDVVLAAASVAAAEVTVAEVIAKLKRSGLTVGPMKTRWTSHPKLVHASIVVDGSAVLWQEELEFVGSKVCLDGNARHAIAHISSEHKCLAKWRTVLGSSWPPEETAQHGELTMWAFLWSSSVWSSKKQDLELECETGGKRDWCEAVPVDGNG